jgi:uncharacterized protein (DUF1697 family)
MSRSSVAFLRGIAPANPLMRNTELRAVFERLGLDDVRTVLSSGNVLFETSESSSAALEAVIEDALQRHLGAPCAAFVVPRRRMERLVAFDGFDDDAGARQQIVTFLRSPPRPGPVLPHEQDGSTVLALHEGALFSVVGASGPALLRWIEREYGKANTTRSWRTVLRVMRGLGPGP